MLHKFPHYKAQRCEDHGRREGIPFDVRGWNCSGFSYLDKHKTAVTSCGVVLQ